MFEIFCLTSSFLILLTCVGALFSTLAYDLRILFLVKSSSITLFLIVFSLMAGLFSTLTLPSKKIRGVPNILF